MYVSCDHNFKQWHCSIWLCVSDCITWLEFYQWLFFSIWSHGSVSVYIWVLVNLWHSFMSISLEIRSDQGHQIELIIGRDQLLIFLGFSLYPFSFHLYLSPFSLVLVLFANIFKSCNFKWPSIRRVAYLIHNAVP